MSGIKTKKQFCSVPDHETIINSLTTENKILQAENKKLQDEVTMLTDKLSKNSSNSSKPPSSDGYDKPAPKSMREKTGKKVGGQLGHDGVRLEQVESPDHIKVHMVDVCTNCGRSLEDEEASEHECRQEFEIPPVKPEVTEHRAEIKLCPACKILNKAAFPKHITQSVQYGINVKATATYFSQSQFIPFDRLQQLFKDCYSLPLSQGSLVNFNKQCSNAVEPSILAIKANVTGGKVAGFDESGMRVKGKLNWLHVARNDRNTYYELHAKRGQVAMEAINILPQFKGTAIHDHWKPYYVYTDCEHGLCNAHHIRELEFIETRYAQSWAGKMIDCLVEINDHVKSNKAAGNFKFTPDLVIKYDRKYSRILREGLHEVLALPIPEPGKKKQHKAKNLLDRLRSYKKDVLRFMNDFDVSFTNNGSESDIRMCKVKSKISGSFRSDEGAKTFCRIRSYISTARKNAVNVMDALHNAFKNTPFIASSDPPTTS